jgi:multiple sugar transport system substrate-binding protein
MYFYEFKVICVDILRRFLDLPLLKSPIIAKTRLLYPFDRKSLKARYDISRYFYANSLKTWDGYISAAKKLNSMFRSQGIEGMHLVGASHAPDIEFYPYLWMLGGDILKQKSGHPTKGTYYYPAFNGTEGVKALSFIKTQIDAGIKPQKQHFWGKEFLDRKFTVMLEAVQNHLRDDYNITTREKAREFEQKVGMIPMFPTPDPSYQSATLLGGWELGIPQTSKNKDLAWELITTMLEPRLLRLCCKNMDYFQQGYQ